MLNLLDLVIVMSVPYLIGRKLDHGRIGDHCTNIAEWVEFSVTGIHKDCQ